MKSILTVIIFFAINLHASEELKLTEMAPKLFGRTTSGGIYNLYAQTQKAKAINFFWVKCKPCKQELPELAKLQAKYPNIEFVSVHTQEVTNEEMSAFLGSLSSAPSTIVLGNQATKERFFINSLPHTIILDKDNIVIAHISGYSEEKIKQLDKILRTLN